MNNGLNTSRRSGPAFDSTSIRTSQSNPRQEFRGTCILAVAFCLGFGFFFSSNFVFDNHPLAFFPLMEITYGALIPWTIVVVLIRIQSRTLTNLDLFFLMMPVLLIGLSSFFAWVSYGQSFLLGIGEERRNLSYLLWFLYEPIQRYYKLDGRAVFRALFWCAVLYLGLSLLIQTFAADRLLARDVPDLDTRKLRITSPGAVFAICTLAGVVQLATLGARRHVLAIVLGFAGLLLVAQTRQITIVVLLFAMLSVLILRPKFMLLTSLAGASALGVLLLTLEIDPITPLIEVLAPNIEEFGGDNFDNNPRGVTLGITTNAIIDNYFIGLGGVSIQHDGGGLQKFYGRHFWLNDVGAFGEVFRIGFFWFILVIVYAVTFFNAWSTISNETDRAITLTLFVYLLVQGITANFLYNNGGAHAFLFLVIAAASRRPTRVRQPRRNDLAGIEIGARVA